VCRRRSPTATSTRGSSSTGRTSSPSRPASGRDVADVARAFFLLGERTPLDRIHDRLAQVATSSRWQRLAAQTLHDDLLDARRRLAERLLGDAADDVEAAVARLVASRADDLLATDRLLRSVPTDEAEALAALTVAVRQVGSLAAR
jgi:NAD-specific glutamate dehydrogenase